MILIKYLRPFLFIRIHSILLYSAFIVLLFFSTSVFAKNRFPVILYTPPPDAAVVHDQFIKDKSQVKESNADSLENTVEKAFSPKNATELSDTIRYHMVFPTNPDSVRVVAVQDADMDVIQVNLPGFFPNWSFWSNADPNHPVTAWQSAFENLPGSTRDMYIPDYQALKDGNPLNGEMFLVANYDENALPVELSVFAAKYDKIEKDIDLRWRTETEVNNAFFDLYRRILRNGEEISPLEKLGRIPGHGNSNSPKEYSFEDKPESIQPGTTFEYTLRQTDNDGTFEDSKLELAINNDDIAKRFNLSQNYPNPFNPSTSIEYGIPEISNVEISLYAITGEKIKTLVSGKKEAGRYTVNLNLSGYATGTYFIRFSAITLNGKVKNDIKKILFLK